VDGMRRVGIIARCVTDRAEECRTNHLVNHAIIAAASCCPVGDELGEVKTG